MKLSCPYSGIRYTVSDGFGSGRAIHPVFQIPLKYLCSTQLEVYLAGRLNTKELHLYGSVLLYHLPIQYWNAPLESPEILEKFWKLYIARIAKVAARLEAYDKSLFPQYVISKETKKLGSFPDYLCTLEKMIDDSAFSPAETRRIIYQSYISNKILEILRTVDHRHRERKKLPELVAQWAGSVGEFPTYAVTYNGSQIPLAEYWKHLITFAFNESSSSALLKAASTYDIKAADYVELLEHCVQHIPFGSLHIDTLVERLRGAIEILNEFRPQKMVESVGVSSIASVLNESGSGTVVSSVNSISTVSTVSLTEPKRHEYKSQIEYLKARIAWSNKVLDAAAAKKNTATHTTTHTNISI